MIEKTLMILGMGCIGLFGIYMILASIRNWSSFRNVSKRIDLIEIFGEFGRILYIILGLWVLIFSILWILGVFEIAPYSDVVKERLRQ